MTVTLYRNVSETNAVNKSLRELVTVTGTLRDSSSLIDPVIMLSDIGSHVGTLNYVHVAEFNRYYFVKNIESYRTGLWTLSLHVDVLYTYRTQIKNNKAIISRNEREYDLKLNDGLFKTQQNPRIAQFPFPSGFSSWDFVLAVAGN